MNVPIIIGAIGHRDISGEAERVKLEVSCVLKYFKNEYKNTPIKLMTALAEGADTIAAQTALEIGCELIVVLPMPIEKYERTFSQYGGKDHIPVFRELISKAENILTSYSKEMSDDENLCFVALGKFIIKHSQGLISVWDGVDNEKPGGTAHVTNCALGEDALSDDGNEAIVQLEDTQPVFYIPVKRDSNPTKEYLKKPEIECLIDEYVFSANDESSHIMLFNKKWEYHEYDFGHHKHSKTKHYSDIWTKIDIFNEDCASGIVQQSEVIEAKEYLVPKMDQSKIPKELHQIMDLFANADVLAKEYQKKTLKILKIMLFFGVLTVFWFAVYKEIIHSNFILILVPMSFFVAALMYRRFYKRNEQEKYYAYRVLAEGTRVQFFWKSACISQDSDACYIKKSRDKVCWIMTAIRNVTVMTGITEYCQIKGETNFEIAIKHWINNQSAYFSKNIRKRYAMMQKYERLSDLFFVLGMVFIIMIFIDNILLQYLKTDFDKLVLKWIYRILVLLAELAFGTGAAFKAFNEKRQFNTEYIQFIRMQNIFSLAKNSLDKAIEKNDKKRIKDVMIELGKESLAENIDWMNNHSAHGVEMPKG